MNMQEAGVDNSSSHQIKCNNSIHFKKHDIISG